MDELGHTWGAETPPGQICHVPLEQYRRIRAGRLNTGERAAAFAALSRINALYMITRAGSGHIGTSFSSIDLMTWLFLQELRRLNEGPQVCDIFFSSKGHDAPALYSVLIGMELLDFELLHSLRRLGGLAGHPHVETPFVQANTGSLGMGISKAKGMVLANRLRQMDRRVYVMTGDGELQEGQIWESLATAAHAGLGELTVIVDHNNVQSDTWVHRTSPLGDIAEKFRAFGWHTAHCDGHDFSSIRDAFEGLRAVNDRPKALIAETVKGRGVSFMESRALGPDDWYRYHSGAPTDDAYSAAVTELIQAAHAAIRPLGDGLALEWQPRPQRTQRAKQERLIGAYSRALLEQAERRPDIVVLDADLILDCGLIPFKERYPERFIECGIAEQDMVSQAGGLARQGLLPIVHSFACFLAARPNEQIYNNASEGSKVIYVGSLAGLLPGGPGHSHQSVRDIAILASVPGLILVEPCAEREVSDVLDFCVHHTSESAYIRLVSLGWELPYTLPSYDLQLGRGVVIRDGDDAVIFAYGPWLSSNAFEAAGRLEREHGLSSRVVNLPWLNRIDPEWLRDIVRGRRAVITLDNHYVDGGQGQMILSALAELGIQSTRCLRLGVRTLPECGTTEEVLRAHGLDVESLTSAIAEAVE